jgi:hypothetical protein
MEDSDKYFIGSSIASGKRTVKSFVIRYGLKRRTVQSYATKVRQGKILRGKSGRSSYLDKEDLAELQDFFEAEAYDKPTEDWREKVYKVVAERAIQRGVSPSQVGKPCARSIDAIELAIGAKTAKAEEMTSARAIDIRNTISYAATNKYMVEMSHPDLILNADATQFTVGQDSKGKVEVKYVKSEEHQDYDRPFKVMPKTKDGGGGMAFFIKYYLLMSASGFTADPIFIIAYDNMGPEEIDVYTVDGRVRCWYTARGEWACGLM